MSELKPCPFCGNKNPRVVHHFVNGIANLSHCFVRCNCGRGKTTASRKEEHGAIDEWNTRPIEDKLQAELARLQTERGELIEDICNYQSELARRDEIIARLKEVGGWMYIAHDEKDIRECEDWRALMKELEKK